MAALSIQDRTRVWRGLMRYWSQLPASDPDKQVAATKYELYNPPADTGMIADLDTWLDAHNGNISADTVGANGAINLA